jgi:hypothetical protein
MSKKVRIVVHCPTCPLCPSHINNSQKTACLHLGKVVHNREQRRRKKYDNNTLKKFNQCDYYKKDSIKRTEIGHATIDCTYLEI